MSNERSLIIAKLELEVIHVEFNQRLPNTWEDRSKVEVLMKLQVKEKSNVFHAINYWSK